MKQLFIATIMYEAAVPIPFAAMAKSIESNAGFLKAMSLFDIEQNMVYQVTKNKQLEELSTELRKALQEVAESQGQTLEGFFEGGIEYALKAKTPEIQNLVFHIFKKFKEA